MLIALRGLQAAGGAGFTPSGPPASCAAAGAAREDRPARVAPRLDGVGILTSIDGKWLGDRGFAPVMDELNRRKAILYTHPTTPPPCLNLIDAVPHHLIEFATDTTRTMASLLLTGTAARCADIKFIFSHAGGTMPFIAERMTWWANVKPELKAKMPNGPLYELKRFITIRLFQRILIPYRVY